MTAERGICGGCGRPMMLRLDGMIRAHGGGHGQGGCTGGTRPPVPEPAPKTAIVPAVVPYGTRKVGEVMKMTDNVAVWALNMRKHRDRLTPGEREAVTRYLSGMVYHAEITITAMQGLTYADPPTLLQQDQGDGT